MTFRKLHESGSLVESKSSGGKFPIRIITEGKGSSGTYRKEVLEAYKDAFAGRPMFFDHPNDAEKPWERSVKNIVGRLDPNVEYREVDGVAGLYTEASVPNPEHQKFIEDFGDLIGVSVYIAGEGKEENGEYIVESFDGSDPYSSVDFVVAAGRGGRVERAIESLRQIETSAEAENGAASADADNVKKERIAMDELKALIESLATQVSALESKVDSIVTLSESAADAASAKVDAFEVADELSKAVAEHGLPEKARKRAIESVKGGKAIAEAVKDEAEYVKEIREAKTETVTAPYGRVVEGDGADYEFRGFGGSN